ncbi:hypothetical protein AV530_018794 [Patagioenas fasciata monilis]|uniref:Uncharacterized protein n=1 Tax=Patagioenas fasciata monilis TaxID=372326 RepID=A0A1V4JJS7_PATFA|nr:hypothetical protein AV530_018794 [Patagioenas fasciata monilis]
MVWIDYLEQGHEPFVLRDLFTSSYSLHGDRLEARLKDKERKAMNEDFCCGSELLLTRISSHLFRQPHCW